MELMIALSFIAIIAISIWHFFLKKTKKIEYDQAEQAPYKVEISSQATEESTDKPKTKKAKTAKPRATKKTKITVAK